MSRKILIIVIFVINIFGALTALTEFESKPIYEPVKDVVFIKLGTYRGFTNDSIEYHKSYFLSRYAKLGWTESQALCSAYGLELVTLETLEEARSLLRLADSESSLRPLTSIYLWIDGLTLTLKSTTDWYWTKTGKKILFPIDWYPGFPSGNNEFCLTISKLSLNANFKFNDGRCDAFIPFICQRLDFFLSQTE